MNTVIKIFAPVTLSALLAMSISQAAATDISSNTQLKIKTSVTEVNGVRDIETGNFEKGIRKSIASLKKSTAPALRKPLLDNLCVAHIALNDMQQAEHYCDLAVTTGRPSALSYSNRAVMNFVAGNMQASVEDIDVASDIGNFKNMIKHNSSIINQQSMLTRN